MDTLTQIVLGASIGELTAGKKIGNKAMLWGGIAGVLPDLDVFLRPIYTQTEYLLEHRGISHSYIFTIFLSPLLAYIAFKIHSKSEKNISWMKWWLLIFLALFTHPILDIMTIYGTGFLEPFNSARLAIGNINIIDPIYTLPMFFSLILIFFFRKKISVNWFKTVFIICHIYLIFTCFNYFYIKNKFKNNLVKQNIKYSQLSISPTFLNNFLWYGTAVNDTYAWTGLYSVFDSSKNIRFYKQNRNLVLEKKVDSEDLTNLIRFSKGFYILTQKNNDIFFYDLRFGYIQPTDYVFKFNFSLPEKSPFSTKITKNQFKNFIKRIFGNK